MAITVTMYSFSKRVNSTAQPTSGTDYSCDIKQPCDIINPVIELNLGGTTSPSYNYAHVSDFGRYYWIDRWTWERGLWIANLSVDALATWKTNIGASSNYVARSSYTYDGAIMDNYYPVKAESTITRNAIADISSPWYRGNNVSMSSFVLGVINSKTADASTYAASNMGAVKYYVLTYGQFRTLMTFLMGDISYMNITDIGTELAKGIINPFEYIVSCMMFPFDMVSTSPPGNAIPISSTTQQISVGWWDTTAVGYLIQSVTPVISISTSITVPKHPQAAARGKYCNMSPYSRYTLNFGPFGTIPIDSSLLQDCATLTCKMDVDLVTGASKLTLANAGGNDFPVLSYAQIGTPIQLAQISTDIVSTISSVAGAGVAAFTGNVVGAISGIVSAAGSLLPQTQTQGGNGSVMGYYRPPELIGEFFTIVDNDNSEHGRPLCQRVTLNTIPGYMLIEEPSVDAPATSAELSQILGYMKTGFYYE